MLFIEVCQQLYFRRYKIPFLPLADWKLHPETLEIAQLQQLQKGDAIQSEEEGYFDSKSEEEGESSDGSDEDASIIQSSVNPYALLPDDD